VKVTVTVGAVSVCVVDVDYTRRQVERLLAQVAAIAAAVQPEPEERAPMGFTAHVEREPTEMAVTYYEDEE
jgi:hypothetical protein